MRPLSIVFQAFGSYPERVEVDFTQLAGRGLFLVTGDTGSGKTTIFDAMCYALYGEMPRKHEKEVRSHHASADLPTFVEFAFESEGATYVARRTPAQERRAKRGGGTVTEKATTSLVRCEADGSTASLATRAADVRTRAVEIVGLEADQFQRVILLPQGEIARFLLANSTEREGLLGQLFGGQVFDAVIESAKLHEQRLRGEVGDVATRIDHELQNARNNVDELYAALGRERVVAACERGGLDPLLAAAQPALLDLELRARSAGEQAQQAATLAAGARAGADRFTRAAKLREELAVRAAAEAAIASDEAAALRSASARPVVTAAEALTRAEQMHREAGRRRDDRLAALRAALAPAVADPDLTSEAAVLAVVNAVDADVERMAGILAQRDAAEAALAVTTRNLEQCVAERSARTTEQLQIQARRRDIVGELAAARAQAVDLRVLDEQITAAAGKVAARTALDAALADLAAASRRESAALRIHEDVFGRFIATAAPRLAAGLQPQEPCPVCGSTEHPHKAIAVDGAPTSFADVDAAAAARDAAIRERQEIDTRVAKQRGRLDEDAETTVGVLRERAAALRTQHDEAQAAHRRVAGVEKEDAQLGERERKLGEDLARVGEKIARHERERQEQESAAAQARAAADSVDAAAVERGRAAVDAARPLCDRLGREFEAVAAAVGATREAAGRLASMLEASPFDTAEAARTVLLPEADEKRMQQAAAAHRDAVRAASASLGTLEQQGIPAECPDVEAADAVVVAAAAAADAVRESFTTARNARDAATGCLERHDALGAASGDLRAAHALARKVHRVLAEGGALAMPLRRWVLANELDRVSAAANVHLQRMTASRYTLRRRLDLIDGRRAFGLDLEVVDAHTGRARSAGSLSGGEQFQASLALALGLADVVSHGGHASGRRFEALFVDEGFGSLDPTALQEAIGALHQLRATGRMVGAITHVEAMKQDLHVGIEVRRLPDGRGSTLRVNP